MNQQRQLTVQQQAIQRINNPQTMDRLQKALPGTITAETYMAQLQIAMGDRSLKDCTLGSLVEAAHFCVTLGLLPTLNHVALIPRDMSKAKDKSFVVCVPMPQWQGYKAIMLRNPEVLDIDATLVHVNDTIRVQRDPLTGAEIVHHDYDPFSGNRDFRDWRDLRGGYVTVTWQDRDRPNKYHFVTADYIKRCAACAETQNVWKNWFQEQCLKTLLRSAWSRRVVNIDPMAASALEHLNRQDDQTLGNDPSRIEPDRPRAIPQSRARQLAHTLQDNRTIDVTPQHEPEPAYEPEPETETEDKPKAKRATKKASKPEPETVEPVLPDHLETAAKAMQACKTTDEFPAIFNAHAKTDSDFEALDVYGSWLLDTGRVKSSTPGQGSLID